MKNLIFFKFTIVFVLVIFASLSLLAQPGNPPSPYNAQGIPVDGGITILAAAGIGFGIKKIKDARKNSNQECGN